LPFAPPATDGYGNPGHEGDGARRNCKLAFDEQKLARPYVQPMLAMLAAAIAAAKISFDSFAVISSSKTELWA
jgi:hypothetical protein